MERIIAKNGVVFYHSEIIPCPHGFSTRIGGVSKLPHTCSLNLGVDRGDDMGTVLENLELFSSAVGVSAKSVISVPQVHSDNIRQVSAVHAGEGFFKEPTEVCDGYISTERGITLGVRTADCVPVLIYAPPVEENDFGGAVMALHAGWRGTALRIVEKAVKKAIDLGGDVRTMRAAIGPSIDACCYEVREDFYNSFLELAGKELTDRYVAPVPYELGVWHADLKGINRELLLKVGLNFTNIDVCDKCTCCENNEFFSHRYSHGIRGTMLSVISL